MFGSHLLLRMGHRILADPERRDGRRLHQQHQNIQVRRNSYIIWFVGAVVWWIDAALHLHAGSRDHALLAIAVSLLFLAAGVVFRRQALRK